MQSAADAAWVVAQAHALGFDLCGVAAAEDLTDRERLNEWLARGYAVGIAQPFPVTIQQLNLWAAKLQQDGFVLVPVTFIAHLRFS